MNLIAGALSKGDWFDLQAWVKIIYFKSMSISNSPRLCTFNNIYQNFSLRICWPSYKVFSETHRFYSSHWSRKLTSTHFTNWQIMSTISRSSSEVSNFTLLYCVKHSVWSHLLNHRILYLHAFLWHAEKRKESVTKSWCYILAWKISKHIGNSIMQYWTFNIKIQY